MNENCWLKNNCNHKDCDKICKRYNILDYMYSNANIPLDKRADKKLVLDSDKIDLESYTRLKNVENDIINFVKNGTNLYIYSNMTGNGKTEWSYKLLRAYINKTWTKNGLKVTSMFISVPKLLGCLKNNLGNNDEYATHFLENVYNTDLIVWDDLATKTMTSFEGESMLTYIDGRLSNNKSNIYTSNISPNELIEIVGDRLYSRIINTSIPIEFKGADKRGLIL
jgi:DNA replication protein DnaC